MEVKMDGAQFLDVFKSAILATLDDQKKEVLLKAAINELLSKKNNQWNSKTMLEECFYEALKQHTKAYLVEFLKTDPGINEMIKGLIADAVKKISEDKRNDTVERIAENIIKGLYHDNN